MSLAHLRAADLAILDWGIGGMGCWRAVTARAPGLDLLYVSDAGATPYGRAAPAALAARLVALSQRLAEAGVGELIVACNAASAALEGRADELALPTHTVVPHGVAAALESGAQHVGVIGGRGTITSGVYWAPLERAGRHVTQRVAQPLSALIEAGHTSGPEIDAALDAILGGLEARVEALLLGCTHYPAAAPAIAARLPGVALLDPIERLVERGVPAQAEDTAPGQRRYVTTGDVAQMRRGARRAFGVEVDAIERAALEAWGPPA